MKSTDFVDSNIEYHKSLEPNVWRENKIAPLVRYKLLQTAKFFINYLDIPNFRVLDIVLTGSMANYNYTKYSDFDVHVVTRYSDLECDDLAEAFYRAKKEIWNNSHDIVIYNHDVELYVEDAEQPPVSEGIYSLLDNKWLNTPKYSPPDIDKGAVNHKVQDLIKQIDVAIETADDPEDLQRITDKLRHMRRSGLDKTGEFSVENLSYKVLRNQGYIDRLYQAHNHQQDQNLSL
jgi:predicted nucleotidyltransferase